MNILLAYNKTSWHKSGYYFEKYFERWGCKVTSIALEDTPTWTNWKGRVPFYFPKGIPKSIGSKFDLVIEIDGAGQHHLARLFSNTPSILWSIDTHLEEKRNFLKGIAYDFSAIFISNMDHVKDFQDSFGGTYCEWLPLACDPDLHRKLDLPKLHDISFIGNYSGMKYIQRKLILQLLQCYFKVNIVQAFGEDMVKVVNESKICFNRSLGGDFNMRVFETLGCGTMLLTDEIKNGLPYLFEDGKDLVLYRSYKELLDEVNYYLTNDEEREKIAEQGRQMALRNTYYHRAKQILDFAEFKWK